MFPHPYDQGGGFWGRLMRFLSNEIRLAETPAKGPIPLVEFVRFERHSTMVFGIYKVTFTPPADPNNRGYKLFYTSNGSAQEVAVSPGSEIKLPSDGSDVTAFLAPVGPDNQVRPDLAGDSVNFKTRIFEESPPPPDTTVQKAPPVSIDFVRFENEDGTPTA